MYNNWEQLKKSCLECSGCQLRATATQVVFGDGNKNSPILFVGEGPGKDEDIKGLPFVGRSGKLLDQLLHRLGLDRSMFFISNIVKCRPPDNRDPTPVEQERCIRWLANQVLLMKPKIIVCLGRVAASRIIKPNFKMMSEHGSWVERKGVLLTAILHPAAVLRNPDNEILLYNDLLAIKNKAIELGLL